MVRSVGSRRSGFGSCGSRAPGRRLGGSGSWASLLRSIWNLPGTGVKPVYPASAGGLLPTVPPGTSLSSEFLEPLSAAPRAGSVGRDKLGGRREVAGRRPAPSGWLTPLCLSEPQFPRLQTAGHVSKVRVKCHYTWARPRVMTSQWLHECQWLHGVRRLFPV